MAVRIHVRASLLRTAITAVTVTLGSSCAHDAEREQTRPPAPTWVDAPLAGAAAPSETRRLARLRKAGRRGRIVRLDRLMDLLDAARFAQDERARETLWTALGGHRTGVGAQATRDASLALLEEALALEEGQPGESRFLADAVMLLSADLQLPASAEDLVVQTLAFRTLIRQGHPRIADNARWRLYDHVRGCLEGAVGAQPPRRLEVAVHALYAEQEDITPWLEDLAPHARPPWPTPDRLWALLQAHHRSLADVPRWQPVVRHRAEADADLQQTLSSTLPAPRSRQWPLPQVPRGTGLAETFGPVLVPSRAGVVVDAGRPQQKRVPLADPDRVAEALRVPMAQDGRGIFLMAAPPLLPSPELHTVLAASGQAGVSRLELAMREPRLGPSDGEEDHAETSVVVALPLEVVRHDAIGPRARAVAQARVRVHLEGRGPRIAVDDRWLPATSTTSAGGRATLEQVRRAYPRERLIALTLAPDVMYQQLLQLMRTAIGGPERRWKAIGWISGGPPPDIEPDPELAALLEQRASLHPELLKVRIEQPYPFRDGDQARLEQWAQRLRACVPELETPLPAKGLRIASVLQEGRLETIEAETRRPQAQSALEQCVREQSYDFHLREHEDRVEIGLVFTRSSDAPHPS